MGFLGLIRLSMSFRCLARSADEFFCLTLTFKLFDFYGYKCRYDEDGGRAVCSPGYGGYGDGGRLVFRSLIFNAERRLL